MVNIPALSASAGLGSLSPFGLLPNPRFGLRLIIAVLKTGHPLDAGRMPEVAVDGCTDYMKGIDVCPQNPRKIGAIDLGLARAVPSV